MTKLMVKTGSTALLSGKGDFSQRIREGLENNIQEVVKELGLMKGSLMKAGQMLSLYSSSFLHPEIKKILKSLEGQTQFLAWDEISKNIPSSWAKELDIEETPLAAASLGQVHKVQPKNGESSFVMKIQYSGVKKAIENDLRFLKWLLKALKVLPQEMDMDEAFSEVRLMLYQETDYANEANLTMHYHRLISSYSEYKIPRIIPEYSTATILSSEFIHGFPLSSPEVQELTEDERSELGKSFLKLLFLEIFEWGMIQTDPNPGNYLVIREDHKVKWGLLDFGATKVAPPEFLKSYQNLILSCAQGDRELFFKTFKDLGYLSITKDSNLDLIWEYMTVISAPFRTDDYDWKNSNIHEEAMKFFPEFMKQVSIGSPPRDAIFLDRKVGGTYFILKELGGRFNARALLQEFIKKSM